jgi:hypothetical protein
VSSGAETVGGIRVGGGEVDGIAMDGTLMGRPRLLPRPDWAADRAMAARNGQPRDQTSKRKSVRAWSPIRKSLPQT